jgi:GNAT superfamily N-acetyltransferase
MNSVRQLGEPDIQAGMRLKDAAGWNQTADDWRKVLEVAPEGCFGIEIDGALVATTTAVCFGRDLAWIGMVLTDPAYRGRGLARRLMEHALEYLRERNVQWIKLDATDMGRPLYERLGFVTECAIERWMRPPGAVERRASGMRFEPNTALDREAFGADRSVVLRALAKFDAAAIPGSGFALGRPGSRAAYFGPCVARSQETARELAAWFLGRHAAESVYWDVLRTNPAAVELAREFGFAPARKLARMSLGAPDAEPLGNRDELVFAAAGFEYG